MSEMVERVKAAISAAIAPAVDIRAPYAKVMVEKAARDAMAAMREPTPEMSEAAFMDDHNEDCGELIYGVSVPPNVWRAMIDAALK